MSSPWSLFKTIVGDPDQQHKTSGSSVEEQKGPDATKDQDVKGTVDARASSEDETSDDDSLNKVDTNAERGVQQVQAITQVWSKAELYTLYIFMWLVMFILAFSNGITSTMTPYVTSSFQEHSLTALTGVVSSLIAGIFKLPYAKIMNIWGRPQGLTLMIGSITLGLIMMAGCNNVATYCAAQVFFWVGFNGIDFTMAVLIADTSKLKNRGFMLGFISSPYLVTTWAYPSAANSLLIGGAGFRWAFGIFAIVVPVTCAPLAFILFRNERKARKAGLIEPRPSRGTFAQTVIYYATEFDVIGLLILATGLALFLLAFNIYSYQPDTWRSPLIICFIVIGFCLIVAFGIWERFAPVTFVPWYLLKDRTVVFTYTMAAALYISWYIWDTYFYSLLIVLFNETIEHARYITNIYTMGSCFISLVYGMCLRYYGKLKIYSLFFGVPLTVLGCGLMIIFRQPGEGIGYIVMCQIFIAFGGGVLVISEQTTLMTVGKQQDFPALLACESMVIAIGSAIGSTVAGAMWTGIFPKRLTANLPPSALDNFTAIYGDIDTQSGYPWGSPERDAINLSYGQTQRYMLIAATCIYATMFVSVALWRNVDVKKMKQRTVGLL